MDTLGLGANEVGLAEGEPVSDMGAAEVGTARADFDEGRATKRQGLRRPRGGGLGQVLREAGKAGLGEAVAGAVGAGMWPGFGGRDRCCQGGGGRGRTDQGRAEARAAAAEAEAARGRRQVQREVS